MRCYECFLFIELTENVSDPWRTERIAFSGFEAIDSFLPIATECPTKKVENVTFTIVDVLTFILYKVRHSILLKCLLLISFDRILKIKYVT